MVFGRSKSSSSTTPSAPSKAAAACAELRTAYHECFNRWYAEKFAKGQWQRDDCADHWHKYRACLEVIPPPRPCTRFSCLRLASLAPWLPEHGSSYCIVGLGKDPGFSQGPEGLFLDVMVLQSNPIGDGCSRLKKGLRSLGRFFNGRGGAAVVA